ncbi:MAG: acylneuraminate cytidylyltransferase family protein [Moorea sp. SIOASIH]|uniref:acylneuraminate cytidylyltransferase family protein n=1 Tax=Moorena sp. SIOASIH TaxID=2607817 RepID=UPI0013B9C705|nr:acylneuraminate cytidylyltransferase family protein [Moorena sp. SIOASIH]NEO35169.1 acylneuraminate cytidylyltransferase family protein [Moorena sp. SIOASIH]
MILGIIPARGGSKSIPLKNIVSVAGKPLIAYTIEAATLANSIDRVIVSTDSVDIANVARTYGAEVPFLRPSELAQDDTPGMDPILHALQWFGAHEADQPDYVLVLQPTSPLRTAEDIDGIVRLALEQKAETAVSVCPVHHHPFWTKGIDPVGKLVNLFTSNETYTRRQDLPPAYALNGALYFAQCQVLIEKATFYTEQTYAYVMPTERSLDIDTSWDLYLAELILNNIALRAGNRQRLGSVGSVDSVGSVGVGG